jgi:signal transduction histidine kinase
MSCEVRISPGAHARQRRLSYYRCVRKLARVWTPLARWAPPVVLGGLALFEIWFGPILQARSFSGPAVVYTPGVLVMSAGLALRTRAPGFCLAAVLGELILEWAYAPRGQAGVSAEWFLAMLVAFYSVGAFCDLRAAAIRLAAAQPVLLALNITEVIRGDSSAGEVIGIYPFVFGLWGAGVAVRRLRLRASHLEDRVGLLARERDEKARSAAAQERARIARELHDLVAHSVTTMVLQASGARQVLRSHTDEADQALRSVEVTGRQALRELRRLLGILRTDDRPRLDPQPGVADLEPLVRQMGDAGLPVELEVTGAPLALAPGFDLIAYRIVQEALTNVLKHAGRVETSVRVGFGADALDIVVRNAAPVAQPTPDGHGLGHGLVGMRERVALYGGNLRAGPDDGGGFTVQAHLPLEGERG